MNTVVLILALLAAPWAHARDLRADMDCRFTGTDFVYDCVIRLDPRKAGVHITVEADMPSMPKAHAVTPVQALPAAARGEYQVRLDLEMTGRWAVKLRLRGAVREELVLHYEFDERGARPVTARGKPPRS